MGALDGRVAIVTGAGAGLGLAIATELARAGAAVAVAEIDAAAGERAATVLGELGVPARFYATDVASREQVDAAFAGAERDLGPIDVVVNNAGISRVGPHTQDVTDEDWHDSIAVMQTGVFYCMRAAGRHMLPRGSRLGGEHLLDPRLLAERGSHDVLRAEGRRDHDDAGRRGRMGTARRPCQRRLPGRRENPYVGRRRRARGDRRDLLPRDGPCRPARPALGGGRAGRLPLLRRRCVHHRVGAHDRRRPHGDSGRADTARGWDPAQTCPDRGVQRPPDSWRSSCPARHPRTPSRGLREHAVAVGACDELESEDQNTYVTGRVLTVDGGLTVTF